MSARPRPALKRNPSGWPAIIAIGLSAAIWLAAIGTVMAQPDAPTAGVAVPPADKRQSAREATEPGGPIEPARDPGADVIGRLDQLDKQIDAREKALAELRRATRGQNKDDIDEEQVRAIEILVREIAQLKSSFEQLALGGLDTSLLAPVESKPYDWQAELLDVIKPVLASLKDLTERPRRIEALRQQVQRAGDQREIVEQALIALRARLAAADTPPLREDLNNLINEWEQRGLEIDSQSDIARAQLNSLLDSTRSTWSAVSETARDFLEGRGLTLGIALLAAAVVWLLVRLVFAILRRLRKDQKRIARRRRDRTLTYLSRLITVLLMTIAVLATFYARSDVFLLALSVLALGLLFVGARQTLPRYLSEIRLLTDFGAAREEERLMLGGLPMQVRDMGAFAILTNPDLKGFARLPLSDLARLTSRPTTGEPWFPSRTGEHVILSDGRFAQVLNQTVDTVTLHVGGSVLEMRSADYYASSPLNLSREGFVSAVTFGIGYRHQTICLSEVPDKIKSALEQAVAAQPYASHCKSILVEFKEAGANSLDYLIVLSMHGQAAEVYLAIPRMIQRTLVALCNREDWDIPFAQLVVHSAPTS